MRPLAAAHYAAIVSLVLIIFLALAWELWLAPSGPADHYWSSKYCRS
jgi:uncharacterized membrane protein